ncbi:MAG TPA: chromosome partitioning protein ParB [Jiangellaceae bacterium]|nr:chromosome partitioning protein ParB [Jiangellaceae bacterium]
MPDTGYFRADAENDFQRARRRQILSQVVVQLQGKPADVSEMLLFDDVVAALGHIGEHRLGLQIVALDTIVGSVGRIRDFDCWFHPRAKVNRQRWIQLALAQRRGEFIPPVDLYRIGELHFVRDGHHRVSVALALRLGTIDGYVTEVTTRVDAAGIRHRGDLVTKYQRRLFLDRVPLPGPEVASIIVTRPRSYIELSEAVEAWGFRLVQREARYLDRATVARRWYAEEFLPVVQVLGEAGLVGDSTDADAYLRLAAHRNRLPDTLRWPDDVVERIRGG